MSNMPVTLTIAGSDSGGGAGIQADLKTFQALGCFGTSAITAITAQNTVGVSAVQAVTVDIVIAQVQAVLSDFPVQAAKTGMLFSAPIIEALADELRSRPRIPLVMDPVMVATSGDRLLETAAENALRALLPQAALITPNLPEAEVLRGSRITSGSAAADAARELADTFHCMVLLKGGHRLIEAADAADQNVIDIFYDGSQIHQISRPLLPGRNTHGTGCTLSAAITAGLAHGLSMLDAIHQARDYLQAAIAAAPGLGAGSGPLNHNHNMQPLGAHQA
ncbi:MAG: bifunctional hydroxymethylpyrimidine kinase/phosphomethylpyrimidine kinase [Leptospiraceae bacterium]|nr:bifunctional hydroxymethylpyrimidine kinase/phosphomethylpyrimidine kinase [Leptospiraceae bacterium]